jgi:glycosyltransferase involved in cell wall biosynthesis
MKICIIVDDYLPLSTKITAKMMHELSVEFVKRGINVTVITPSPTLDKTSEISQMDGVTVCRFQSGKIKNTSKVKRLINEFLLPYKAQKAFSQFFKENPHDLIIFWSPSIFWSGLIKKLKSIWAAPSYMLLRDFFPQWVIDSGMLKEQSLLTRFFRYFEKINYQNADVIALQSPKNIEWFANFNKTNIPLDLLYNWASDIPTPYISDTFRKKLGLENKTVFFYGGNIGHAQDMMNIVRLAKNLLSESHVHFILVGTGDEFELVARAIINLNLSNMTLLPAVSQDIFKLMLSEFDVGLFSLHRDHTTHNFPGKLLAYMVQGLPILGSVNTDNDLKELIENYNAGFVSINGDDDTLFKNAKRLLDANLRHQMGQSAKQLLHDVFSVESAVDKILNFYNTRLKK